MAIIAKKGTKTKYGLDHNYSGFWMDRGMATSALSSIGTSSSNTVKALRLRNYQRAISNFVKILSRKDVPVYVKGTDSYTDFDHVVIAADIKDSNFDVTAALALHEASHLKYTTKGIMESVQPRPSVAANPEMSNSCSISQVRGMFNWIEDRRIDTLVFKSCPGYKAYYHKLYDHYFRNKEMGNMLMSDLHCKPEFTNYMNHIIGMLHPAFDSRRMPGLGDIVKLIDVNNIGRLKTAEDALALSGLVVDLINKYVEEAAQDDQDEQGQGGDDQSDQNEESSDDSQSDSQSTEDTKGEKDDGSTAEGGEAQKGSEAGGGGTGDGNGEGGDEGPEMNEHPLSPTEHRKVSQALEKAREMVNGEVSKKQATNSLAKTLQKIQAADIDVQKAGTSINRKGKDVLIYNVHRMEHIVSELVYLKENEGTSSQLAQACKTLSTSFTTYGRDSLVKRNELIMKGMEVGAMLGKKMLTRREDRQLITNRLRTGKIDARRIAHAGYGIETVFNQINIDTYKNANIHLTIDASGSMNGSRWDNTVIMSIALAKACSMVKGLDIQISGRETLGESAVVSMLFDSRVNKLVHAVNVFKCYDSRSMTPEGLCLEGMLKNKMFVPQTQDCDSYMINICDGAPGMSGYGGWSAIEHTKSQVKKINGLGINHIGYFFGDPNYGGFANFKAMYGVKESVALENANNATEIAKHLNKQLMSK